MLRILNNLKPFFEDCYRRINVREYARITKISPPTASKLLENYRKQGLLKKQEDRLYFFYYADKDSKILIDLSRIYWQYRLDHLLKHVEEGFLNPVIILFGSLSKAEVKSDSDIDLAIISPTTKNINIDKYEKELKRKIQLFTFKDIKDIKSKELLNNVLNGYKMRGSW